MCCPCVPIIPFRPYHPVLSPLRYVTTFSVPSLPTLLSISFYAPPVLHNIGSVLSKYSPKYYCQEFVHYFATHSILFLSVHPPATRKLPSYPSSGLSQHLALLTLSHSFKNPLHVSYCSFRTVWTHWLSVMEAQASGRAAGSGRSTTYSYRTLNEILYNIVAVIHRTVPDDAGDNNQLRSTLWRWTDANALLNDASERVERASAYRKSLEPKSLTTSQVPSFASLQTTQVSAHCT